MNPVIHPLSICRIIETPSYTGIVLESSQVTFCLYTEPHVGTLMHKHLEGQPPLRPQTHDLISKICQGFDIQLTHALITDVQDKTFYARLFLSQPSGESTHLVEVDARPSDCLVLALQQGLPLYCTEEVLQSVLPYED